MDFNITNWAAEYELEEGTINALAEKGFKTRRSLSKLTPDIIKKELKGLLVAQLLLLVDAVEALKPRPEVGFGSTMTLQPATEGGSGGSDVSSVHAATQSDIDASHAAQSHGQASTVTQGQTSTQGTDVSDIWRLLGGGEAGNDAQNHLLNTGKPLIFDPFNCDSNGTKKPTPFRDIRDYVVLANKQGKYDNNSEILQVGSHELLLTDKRPAYSSLSVAQYTEASMRILREMAIKDNISRSEMLDYVNYVIKVATLSQSFSWESVLKYDMEYRKSQAEMSFRWGADNSYLMQLLLKAPTRKPATGTEKPAARTRPNMQDKYDPRSGKPICRKWNQEGGCTFNTCRYAHVCIICFTATHTAIQHAHTQSQPRTHVSHSITNPQEYNTVNQPTYKPADRPPYM